MKKLFLAVALLVTSFMVAQVRLEGVVRDSIGNPLELANVIAINQSTQKLDSYGITGEDGKYRISLKKNTVYTVQASYVGMKTSQAEITTQETNVGKDFVLYYDNALDEVELVYEMPVTVKGDTITYNADSFNKGTERELGDVLENLPGVEINDDGQIEVEGKVVSKLMVEGKDFFDGDTKLAVENIPSNAVDKVEVLKNYSEISQLSGVTDNQDNIAINIKLKEGKKNFWFGNITTGGGASNHDGLYLFQPKLFYYSPTYSINTIVDLNNIGEVAFSRRDYFNFTGGFRAPSRSSGTNIDLGTNNLGFLTMQNNRAKDIETKFGAANFSWSPNKELDLSGFVIFSKNKTEMQENSQVTYTDSDLGIPDESTESNTLQRSDLGMLKLSAVYKPNANNQLDYDVLARISKESQEQGFFSSVNGNIGELESSSPYSINHNLNYYYTLNDSNIFALEVQHLLQDEDPFYNAIIEDKEDYEGTANNLGLEGAQVNYNLAQDKRLQSNQMDAKLDYWNVLNNKSDINVTLGTILSTQQFNSEIFQFLDDDTKYDPTPTINDGLDTNDIKYNFSDLYLGLHYRLKSGIFTFTPGVSAHAYSTKNIQYGTTTTDNFFRLLPDFNMRVQLKQSEQIIFDYSMETEFTDVSNFAKGLVLNSYSSLFSGSPDLESALSHNFNLSYFSFNMFNYTNVRASLNYNKSIDNIRTMSTFEPGSVVRVSTPFNSSFADESASANTRVQRTFGKIRASLGGNLSYSKFNQFVQDERSISESFSQSYNAELRTNFKTAPNIELGYKYSVQDNNLGDSSTKYFTKSPSVEIDALILKSFTLKSDYSYNNYSDEDRTINTYEFLNASLSYKKNEDSKFEYEIKATNLFNTKSQNNTNTSTVSVSATEYYIQPLYVSFRLRYEL